MVVYDGCLGILKACGGGGGGGDGGWVWACGGGEWWVERVAISNRERE